jgi:two-component system response regulator HydG
MSESFSILIVDDDPSNAGVLADILDVKGFIVHAANSGAEALLILREHPVNILLTDVKMPGMNGVELYRAARQINPALATILMTAYAADNLIQQGMSEGIRTVLNKPLDIDLLLALISAYTRINS